MGERCEGSSIPHRSSPPYLALMSQLGVNGVQVSTSTASLLKTSLGRSMNIDIWIVLSSEPSEDDDAQDIGE